MNLTMIEKFQEALAIAQEIKPHEAAFRHSDRRKMRRGLLAAQHIIIDQQQAIARLEVASEGRTTIEEF